MKNTKVLITLEKLKRFFQSRLSFQEKLLFMPNQYQREEPQDITGFVHEEYYLTVEEGISLHGVLFKSSSLAKGLIFYVHGNKAIIDNLDISLDFYLNQSYDLFTWDYRGYGNSGSKIESENQFYSDAEKVFYQLMQQLSQQKVSYQKVIILGYSLGTFLAVKLAAEYPESVHLLILKAPYYSLIEVVRERFSLFVPKILFKYPLETYRHMSKIKVPIVIFHGKKDFTISYQSSIKLKQLCKESDKLYLINDLGHSPFDTNEDFRQKFATILSEM